MPLKIVLLLSLQVMFSLNYLILVPQIPMSFKWRMIIPLLVVGNKRLLQDLLDMLGMKIVD